MQELRGSRREVVCLAPAKPAAPRRHAVEQSKFAINIAVANARWVAPRYTLDDPDAGQYFFYWMLFGSLAPGTLKHPAVAVRFVLKLRPLWPRLRCPKSPKRPFSWAQEPLESVLSLLFLRGKSFGAGCGNPARASLLELLLSL